VHNEAQRLARDDYDIVLGLITHATTPKPLPTNTTRYDTEPHTNHYGKIKAKHGSALAQHG